MLRTKKFKLDGVDSILGYWEYRGTTGENCVQVGSLLQSTFAARKAQVVSIRRSQSVQPFYKEKPLVGGHCGTIRVYIL